MSRARLSIIGLYDWDSTIFDYLTVPENVEKQKLINLIMYRLAELEVIYPDSDTMKSCIRYWSAAHSDEWGRMAKALQADYEPIENYDRREEWNDSAEGTNSSTGTSSNQSDSTSKATGYNSGDLVTVGSASGTGTGTASSSSQAQSSSQHSGRVHGNIGVTTNQQMIESEISLRTKYDIYDIIIEEFKREFCILVY